MVICNGFPSIGGFAKKLLIAKIQHYVKYVHMLQLSRFLRIILYAIKKIAKYVMRFEIKLTVVT